MLGTVQYRLLGAVLRRSLLLHGARSSQCRTAITTSTEPVNQAARLTQTKRATRSAGASPSSDPFLPARFTPAAVLTQCFGLHSCRPASLLAPCSLSASGCTPAGRLHSCRRDHSVPRSADRLERCTAPVTRPACLRERRPQLQTPSLSLSTKILDVSLIVKSISSAIWSRWPDRGIVVRRGPRPARVQAIRGSE